MQRVSAGMILPHLILTLKPKEIFLQALYRTQDGPGPNTKACCREVTELARTGLEQALEALESSAKCLGTVGFTTREDVLLATASPASATRRKRDDGNSPWGDVETAGVLGRMFCRQRSAAREGDSVVSEVDAGAGGVCAWWPDVAP